MISATSCDAFDHTVIKQVVTNFYAARELPTVNLIRNRLAQQHNMNVSGRVLRSALKKCGFTWQKIADTKKVGVEQPAVIHNRVTYLRTVQEFRDKNWQIAYLDETWVNKNTTPTHTWLPAVQCDTALKAMQHRDVTLPNLPTGKGSRLIILHVGSSKVGFLPGCDLVFQGVEADGDYHREMNSKVFMDWFENNLMRALTEPTVIVIDNAPYHNLKVDSSVSPTTATKKADMQAYLTSKGVKYQAQMTKPQLYELIKLNKPEIRYKTDEIAEHHGHIVVRTPVRHCELNVIELLWANVKNFVARNNTSFKIKDVEKLVHDAFAVCTVEDWKKAECHVLKTEERMRRLDGVQDVQPIIISLDDSCSDSDDDAM